MSTEDGPAISCHSLSQPPPGVSMARRMRRRAAGSLSRSNSRAVPPPAPTLLPLHLQVPDLDWNVRLAPDPDGLVERRVDLGALRAHMRSIDAAELRGLRGERDQFLGV